ncbi:prepilin peptidase [Leifsonia sp. ZF2019]|uniref:prepilin peptidase n=1 Tax=Leifsonia sp. ZF2019 TaxID=2781978 RepID=UPI001CBFDE7F|nr:prepilin peptidase [Leifsonia sp. ZF2019]
MGEWRGITAATAVGLGAALLLVRGAAPAAVVGLYIAAVTAPLIATDVRERRLPDALVLPGYAVAAVGLGSGTGARAAAGVEAGTGVEAVVCALVVLAVMAVLWAAGGVGMGDVKLAGLLAAALSALLDHGDGSANVAVSAWLGAAFATVAMVGAVEWAASRAARCGVRATAASDAGSGTGVRGRGLGAPGREVAFGPVLLGCFWAVVLLA